jgi:hypothetical protein
MTGLCGQVALFLQVAINNSFGGRFFVGKYPGFDRTGISFASLSNFCTCVSVSLLYRSRRSSKGPKLQAGKNFIRCHFAQKANF